MLCALLVFRTPGLPAPLAKLSPWVDWLGQAREHLFAELEAQAHRRFLKTHTPLDGLPQVPQVTYLVVAREPLDAAVSLYHQASNIDRERVRELLGSAEATVPALPPLSQWVRSWAEADADPFLELDSLNGMLQHAEDAWQRRSEHVHLFHYADLESDLEAQMHRLAGCLDIDVPEQGWSELVAAARFGAMRDRAEELAPDQHGVFHSRAAFFRGGRSGAGRDLLSEQELRAYLERTGRKLSPEVHRWLHRPGLLD